MIKRFIALLLTAVFLSSLPAYGAESEVPAPDDLFVLGDPSDPGHIALIDESAPEDDAYTVSVQPAMSAAGVSSAGQGTSYDPRNSGTVTPARTQRDNTCWAVAAIGAAEVDGLNAGLLSTGAADTDLSERHLIYFLSHPAPDPLGNSSGDYNTNPSLWITGGGNPPLAIMTLASWHGPASEAATNTPYSGLSSGDSIPSAYAYADELHLENAYALDISTADGRSALQSMIRQYGSAVLCLYFNPGSYTDYLFAGSPSAATETVTADAAQAVAEEEPALDVVPEEDDPTAPETEAPETPSETTEPITEEPTPSPDAVSEEESVLPTEAEEPQPEEPEAPDSEEVPAAEEEIEDPEAASAEEPELPSPDETEAAPALDGAAAAIVPLDGAAPGGEDFTACYYMDPTAFQERLSQGDTPTTHEMLIVGWDDNYPAQNFGLSPSGAVPAGDGAWLCRNSYGPDWGDGGYVWVSYYDPSVCQDSGGSITARATVFDFGPADNYDHNYEYDGAAILGYVNDQIDGKGVSTIDAGASTLRWYANIFTAAGNPSGAEALKAVSTYTYRANVPYTVEIYKDLENSASPLSGTLAATVSGTFVYAGFHTVVLPEPVALREGERYSVVIRVGMASDKSVFVPSCYTSSSTSSKWYSVNDSRAGQSFVSLDGSRWLDCYDLKDRPNVRLKAYTDDVAAPEAVLSFTDVARAAWYYGDVEAAWRKGLVKGMSSTSYVPEGAATRAQVITTLWRMTGEPTPDKTSAYSDVKTGAWYSDAVAWAEENGIVTGYPDGTFHPSDSITRQEFMTVLYRYAQWSGIRTSQTASLSSFRDGGAVSGWARDAVVWSVAAGLQKGVLSGSGTHLVPNGTVTRAQLAAFLNRFSQMI